MTRSLVGAAMAISLLVVVGCASPPAGSVADCDASAAPGVDWSGCDKSGSLLRGADLSGADLSGTDLTYADLIDADLSGADLSGATLLGATLFEADLGGVLWYDTTCPDGQVTAPSGPLTTCSA